MARKLKLKTVPLGASAPDEAQEMNYRDMLSNILRMPLDPRAGIDFELMGKRLKLLDKLKTAGEFVVFEEAEWNDVCVAFKAFKFTRVFSGIVQLGEDLLNAEEIELKE